MVWLPCFQCPESVITPLSVKGFDLEITDCRLLSAALCNGSGPGNLLVTLAAVLRVLGIPSHNIAKIVAVDWLV